MLLKDKISSENWEKPGRISQKEKTAEFISKILPPVVLWFPLFNF